MNQTTVQPLRETESPQLHNCPDWRSWTSAIYDGYRSSNLRRQIHELTKITDVHEYDC